MPHHLTLHSVHVPPNHYLQVGNLISSAPEQPSGPAVRCIATRVLHVCPSRPAKALHNFFSSTICHFAEILSEIWNIVQEFPVGIEPTVYRQDVIPIERVCEVIQSLPANVGVYEGSDVNTACVLDVDIVLRRVELELFLPLELVPECL